MELVTKGKNGKLETRQWNPSEMQDRKNSEPPARESIGKDNFINLTIAAYKAITGDKITQVNEVINHAQKMADWAQNWAKKPWLKIAGYVGNGKTTMVNAFRMAYERTNTPKLFPVVTAERLAKMAHSDPQEFERLIALPRLIIDDIGMEPGEITSYGNKIRPITEALMARYCRRALTIYTTNLTEQDITDQYGERLADRMAELQTKIIFTQKDSFRRMDQ